MITADNITDAQIEELMRVAKIEGHKATVYTCKLALDDGATHQRADRIREARQRVAEILNSRANGATP